MRRIHLGIVISAILICIISGVLCISCTNMFETENTQTTKETSQLESFDNLINNLQQMSEKFMISNNIVPSTRASWFGRLWRAVKADVRSIFKWNEKHPHPELMMEIAVQDTGTSSYMAYYADGFVIPVYDDDNQASFVVDSLSSIYAYSEEKHSFATAHNAAVLGMIKSNSFDPNSTLNTILGIRNVIKELGIIQANESVEDAVAFVDEFLSDYYEHSDKHLVLPTKPKDEDQMVAYLIDYYFENVQQLTSPESVRSYTREYIETVQSDAFFTHSEDNAARKQYVTEMVGLGAASFDLWYHIAKIEK